MSRDIMLYARTVLSGQWKTAVLVTLLYVLVNTIPQAIPAVGGLVAFLVSGAFLFGYSSFALAIARGNIGEIEDLFQGFSQYRRTTIAYFLLVVLVLLWSLLLIIPGIIKGIAYSQTFFILASDPDILPSEAIQESQRLMYGHKWQYALFTCRFLGWFLLGFLSLGIGFLWIFPYFMVSLARFYDELLD